MRRLCLSLLLLVTSAFGQSNGFRADHVQANGSGATTVKYLDFVTSGNLLWACYRWLTTGQTLTVTDTLGSTWTKTTQLVSTAGDGSVVQQCAYALAASTGADTVTFGGVTSRFGSVVEYKNTSATLDIEATANTTTGATSLTTTPTTTVNGDLCLSFQGQRTGLQAYTQQQVVQGVAGTGTASRVLNAFQNTGLAGAQSLNIKVNAKIGNPAEWGIITDCFLPASAAIVTDTLPHAAQSVAYQATLQEAGLAGAETWSATGLPSGLSIASSTGVISGTYGGSVGCTNVNFSVHDPGSVHTATETLPLCAGASFATPALVQHKPLAGSGNTFASPVTSGNLLIANVWGQENFGSLIWFPSYVGTNNKLFDTLGTVWHRVSPLVGVPGVNGPNGAIISTYVGCATSSGTDTVDYSICTNSGSCGFHGNVAIEEWSGLQNVVDDGVNGNTAGGVAVGGIAVTTASYPAQVANEVLHWTVARGQNTAPTLGGSFTTIDSTVLSTVDLGSAYYIPGAAGNYTATDTESGVGGGIDSGDVLTSELFGLRPEISGLACGGTPVGATQVRHKVELD